jgi:hypothetical protein
MHRTLVGPLVCTVMAIGLAEKCDAATMLFFDDLDGAANADITTDDPEFGGGSSYSRRSSSREQSFGLTPWPLSRSICLSQLRVSVSSIGSTL